MNAGLLLLGLGAALLFSRRPKRRSGTSPPPTGPMPTPSGGPPGPAPETTEPEEGLVSMPYEWDVYPRGTSKEGSPIPAPGSYAHSPNCDTISVTHEWFGQVAEPFLRELIDSRQPASSDEMDEIVEWVVTSQMPDCVTSTQARSQLRDDLRQIAESLL